MYTAETNRKEEVLYKSHLEELKGKIYWCEWYAGSSSNTRDTQRKWCWEKLLPALNIFLHDYWHSNFYLMQWLKSHKTGYCNVMNMLCCKGSFVHFLSLKSNHMQMSKLTILNSQFPDRYLLKNVTCCNNKRKILILLFYIPLFWNKPVFLQVAAADTNKAD